LLEEAVEEQHTLAVVVEQVDIDLFLILLQQLGHRIQ
jgi:hypothetical protein